MESTDLRFATSIFGRIRPEYAKKIKAYIRRPDFPGWDDIAHIIINGQKWMTVWQAVLEVDPGFCRTGRTTDIKGRIIKDWGRIPSAGTVREAIYYATH